MPSVTDDSYGPAAAHAGARWTALVLAGERPGGDPLARHFGAPSKALIRVGGMTMLRRVVTTLLVAPEVARVVIVAQQPQALMADDAAGLADHPRVALATSGGGIATSIAALAGTDIAPWPVLVTTADHPLLTPAMVAQFFAGAGTADLALGVGERRTLEARFPENRRTWLKFADGHYSGTNLFALQSPRVGRALALWSTVEQDRKKAWKLFSRFGPYLLVRALTRTIGFPAALARAGRRLGLSAVPVVLSAPEAPIDVDKVSDWELAERILAERAGRP